jgi:ATP-dependent Lon protease
MATSIASALTRVPVKSSVAMTGEITLQGRVLPIGGLKEKMIAAHRGGIETLVIPKENEKDLAEIPQNIKRDLEIIPVEHMDEVLVNALAVADPSSFLREGDHEFEDIFDTGVHAPTSPPELPTRAGVN